MRSCLVSTVSGHVLSTQNISTTTEWQRRLWLNCKEEDLVVHKILWWVGIVRDFQQRDALSGFAWNTSKIWSWICSATKFLPWTTVCSALGGTGMSIMRSEIYSRGIEFTVSTIWSCICDTKRFQKHCLQRIAGRAATISKMRGNAGVHTNGWKAKTYQSWCTVGPLRRWADDKVPEHCGEVLIQLPYVSTPVRDGNSYEDVDHAAERPPPSKPRSALIILR